MGRELRLAFAMGGGVSLGTFSGAALTEAMKLAVLYGAYPTEGVDGDTEWVPYDRVVVDVFSGASAGAMSLAAMLRSLVHQTSEQREAAERTLRAEHGDAFAGLPPRKQEQAVAAQVAQDVQERVWVEEVDIHRLLGSHNGHGHSEGQHRDLRHVGGVFDRRAVDDIARSVIGFPRELVSGGTVTLAGKSSLLADRAVFACTLANLTPLVLDARSDLNTPASGASVGFEDGLTSQAHRDIRVFDLNFTRVEEADTARPERYPGRWLRYHAGAKEDGRIGDLRAETTWKRIAATAIAAGAFPFAFEPVVLTRKGFEYGDLWPFAGDAAGDSIEEYPFTYVDGGMFNNEPIREAFRMASVVDAIQPDAPAGRTYDRRVIFVDPNTAGTAVSYRVPIHETYAYQSPNFFGALDGTDLYRKSSLDRLLPHVGQMLSVLKNQSRVNEADSVFQVRRRFENRDRMRSFLAAATTEAPDRDLLQAVRTYSEQLLTSDAANMVIPAGSLTLAQELERVRSEEQGRDGDSVLDGLTPGSAASFLEDLDTGRSIDSAGAWLRALLFVALDLTLNLEGKHPSSRVIAIAPAERTTDPQTGEPALRRVALKGGWMAGFGGFTSAVPGRHEVALARTCTRDVLEQNHLLPPETPRRRKPAWTADMQHRYTADLNRGIDAVIRRIDALIGDSHLLNLSALNPIVGRFLSGFLEKRIDAFRNLDRPETTTYEFRVTVPGKRFEIDGDRDQRPIRLEDPTRFVLVTKAAVDIEGHWTGPFIDTDRQQIRIDQEGLPDRWFCAIALPTDVRPLRFYPNPVFYASVEPSDKGSTLGADRWQAEDPVAPSNGDTAVHFGLSSLEEQL